WGDERGEPVASRSLTSSTSLRPAGAPLRNPSAAQALHVSDDVTGAIGQLGVELRDLLDRRVLVDGVLEVGHRHAEELEQPARLVAGHAPSFVRTVGARQTGPSPLGSRASYFNPMVGARRAGFHVRSPPGAGPQPQPPCGPLGSHASYFNRG